LAFIYIYFQTYPEIVSELRDVSRRDTMRFSQCAREKRLSRSRQISPRSQ